MVNRDLINWAMYLMSALLISGCVLYSASETRNSRSMKETDKTTKDIINFINNGFGKAWRSNNIRVKGRTFNGLKGTPDIEGHTLIGGTMIGIEVKTGNDKLSKEQYEFLTDLHNSGGYAYVAESYEHFLRQHVVNKKPDPFVNFLPPKLIKELNLE